MSNNLISGFFLLLCLSIVGYSLYTQQQSNSVRQISGKFTVPGDTSVFGKTKITQTQFTPPEQQIAAPPEPHSASEGEATAPQQENSPYDVLPIAAPDDVESQAASLEARFANETYDVEWAPEATIDTQQKFYDAQLTASELIQVDCRSSMCKLEVSHADVQAEAAFMNKLLEQANGEQGHIDTRTGDHGEPVTVVYRIRQ